MSRVNYEWCHQPAMKRIWEISRVNVAVRWDEDYCTYTVQGMDDDDWAIARFQGHEDDLAQTRALVMEYVLRTVPR